MTVKLVYDEDYNLIGVASNWESAIDLAIESNCITGSTKIYPMNEDGYVASTVEWFFGKQWKEAIKNLDETNFYTLFKRTVHFADEEVYTIE